GCHRISPVKYGLMNDISSDDIFLLKQRLAEQGVWGAMEQ
ncbi:hypothetical protein L403_04717, partial [Escherichia coli BWH 32]